MCCALSFADQERTGKYKSWRTVQFLFFLAALVPVSVFVVVVVFVLAFASLVVSGSCLLTLCGGVVSYNLFLL